MQRSIYGPLRTPAEMFGIKFNDMLVVDLSGHFPCADEACCPVYGPWLSEVGLNASD